MTRTTTVETRVTRRDAFAQAHSLDVEVPDAVSTPTTDVTTTGIVRMAAMK